MTYAIVRQQENSLTSAASSVSTGNWSVNPVAGNLIWLVAGTSNTGKTFGTPTDSAGNTYTLIGSCVESGTGQRLSHWYAKNVSTAGVFQVTVPLTTSTDRLAIYALEISGLDTTAPLDGHSELGSNPGSGTNSVVSGSASNSWTPGVILGFNFDLQGAAQNAGTSPISFTGLTKVWNQLGALANQGLPEHAATSTASSKQATAQDTGSDRHCMVMAMFKESGATSAGTTLALTGTSVTVSRGSLVSSVSPPLVGRAITASTGTLGVSVSRALTGSAVAISQGALGAAIANALSGQVVTGSAGTLAPSISGALSGQAGTFAQGAINTALALTGQSATFTQGSLSIPATTTLIGQLVTVSQGSASPNVSVALIGQAIAASQSSFGVSVASPLAGQAVSAAQGSVAATVLQALTGQQATFSQGTLTTPGTTSASLTGQQIGAAQGIVGSSISLGLTGLSVSVQAGSLAGSTNVALSGQSAAVSAGTLAATVSAPLQGQSSVWQTGNIIVPGDVTRSLLGIEIAVSQGQLGIGGLAPAGHSREKEKRRVGLEINGKLELFESPEEMQAWLDAQKPKKAKAVVKATKALAQKLVATPGFSAFTPGDFKGAAQALGAFAPIYQAEELAEIATAIEDDDDEEALMLMLNHESEMLAMLVGLL